MIESVETLDDILEPYANQTVFCEEDKKIYQWSPIEGWEEIHLESNLTISAYEMNKQIIGQLQILDNVALEEKKKLIREFTDKWKQKFYMLLCRDLNYYTVFYMDLKIADEPIEDALLDCVQFIGDIKSIENTEDECAIEIWVTNSDNETYAMYFFPYDNGVLVCG